MTIKYSDGNEIEAVLLSRGEDTIRVAAQGADDTLEFTNIRGTWVSSNCEPVTIVFAWQRHAQKPTVTEADCVCSQELAARLLHLLFAGSDEERACEAPVEAQPPISYAAHFVV